jgi:hypothetical protein
MVANVGRRTPDRARGVGSTPGRPASPINAPPPPLHDPTLPHDRAEASAALSPRFGLVSCTPRASPAFPVEGERDRAVPRPFLQGIINPSPSATPFELKPTSAMRTSSTNHARALKTTRFRPQCSTTDASTTLVDAAHNTIQNAPPRSPIHDGQNHEHRVHRRGIKPTRPARTFPWMPFFPQPLSSPPREPH